MHDYDPESDSLLPQKHERSRLSVPKNERRLWLPKNGRVLYCAPMAAMSVTAVIALGLMSTAHTSANSTFGDVQREHDANQDRASLAQNSAAYDIENEDVQTQARGANLAFKSQKQVGSRDGQHGFFVPNMKAAQPAAAPRANGVPGSSQDSDEHGRESAMESIREGQSRGAVRTSWYGRGRDESSDNERRAQERKNGKRDDGFSAVHGSGNSKPNVFFFMIDDMGWNDIGYQSTDLSMMTPRLNALASEGVKVGETEQQSHRRAGGVEL